MRFDEITELFYITPIENVPSMLKYGIFCHQDSELFPHQSMAKPEVQERRSKVIVPVSNKPLHSYANLYINARNTTLYCRKDMYDKLCVLSIDPAICNIPGVIISDRNAAANEVKFALLPKGWELLQSEAVFARTWVEGQIKLVTRRAQMCAEILVPNYIGSRYILRIYVHSNQVKNKMMEIAPNVIVLINYNLFFVDHTPAKERGWELTYQL